MPQAQGEQRGLGSSIQQGGRRGGPVGQGISMGCMAERVHGGSHGRDKAPGCGGMGLAEPVLPLVEGRQPGGVSQAPSHQGLPRGL